MVIPVTSFEAIFKVYNLVAQSINSELLSDNTQNETRFVERLYNGIKHCYKWGRWHKHGNT